MDDAQYYFLRGILVGIVVGSQLTLGALFAVKAILRQSHPPMTRLERHAHPDATIKD